MHACFSAHHIDVTLPVVGSFALQVTVYDNNGAFTTATIEGCSIELLSSTDMTCNDLTSIILQIEENSQTYLSTHSKFEYLFQHLQSILEYLNKENNDMVVGNDCLEEITLDMLDIIHDNFGTNYTSLCESSYTLVCVKQKYNLFSYFKPFLFCTVCFVFCVLFWNIATSIVVNQLG